jgi:hypothetical protein
MTCPPGPLAACSLDHVVVTTPDLDLAATRWAALGFQLSPRGRHESLGTENHTAMFADGVYLELLGVADPGPGNVQFQAAIREHPDGVGGLALKTSDAARFAAMRPRLCEAAVSFSREVVIEGSGREARFTVVRLVPGATPLPSVFACQHHTPELVWRSELLSHPNGVVALAAVAFEGPAPASEARAVAYAMGASSAPFGPGHAVFGPGPFLGFAPGEGRFRAVRLVFEVDDIGRALQALDGAGIDVHGRGGDVLVVPPGPGQAFECCFRRRRHAVHAEVRDGAARPRAASGQLLSPPRRPATRRTRS